MFVSYTTFGDEFSCRTRVDKKDARTSEGSSRFSFFVVVVAHIVLSYREKKTRTHRVRLKSGTCDVSTGFVYCARAGCS